MDSFELSKIAGAVAVRACSSSSASGRCWRSPRRPAPEKPGFTSCRLPASRRLRRRSPGPALRSRSGRRRLRSRRRGAGRRDRQRPERRHDLQEVPGVPLGREGGPNKVGPNLWGVVGRPKASHEGFNYSDAMKAKGGNWTPEDLASFVHGPKTFVPGTKMLFPGIAGRHRPCRPAGLSQHPEIGAGALAAK